MTHKSHPNPAGNLPPAGGTPGVQQVLQGLSMLPQRPGVSFRGWVPDPGLPPHTLVTRLITATSLDPVIATMGWSTGQLGVIVGRSGRDMTFVSEVPKAAEVTYLPWNHVPRPCTDDHRRPAGEGL